jgi:hypothetical protein
MTELTDPELKAINLIIAELESSRRDRMLADLAVAEIEVLIADRSMLRFHLPGHVPSKPGLSPFGRVWGQDGELLDVVIFEDGDGRLFEVERVRPGEGPEIVPS